MWRLVVLVACLAIAGAAENKAIVVLTGTGISGTVTFTETGDGVLIEGKIQGLEEGLHGFHVHALGDLSDGCTSTKGHFNPENVNHGAPNATVRHVGDLGNIVADSSGVANINFTDKIIALSGKNCIIGRGVVVHEKEDDLGLGGHELSLTTGNAGGRVACGVIGILEEGEPSGSNGATLTPVILLTITGLFANLRNL